MILPQPPEVYNQQVENERNRSLRLADQRNRKIDQDVELGDERLIIRAPDGSRWALTVDNSGVLGATAL